LTANSVASALAKTGAKSASHYPFAVPPAEHAAADEHTRRGEDGPRVALFTDSDAFAGTERHILELALALNRLEVPVQIACPQPSPLASKATAASLPLIPIAKQGLVDLKAISVLKNKLQRGEINILHAHNGRAALNAVIAVHLAGRGRCVFTQHFIQPARTARRGLSSGFSKIAHWWVNRRINHFIAISQAVKNAIHQRCDAVATEVTVVPNGISLPAQEDLEPVALVRSRLGLDEKTPLICCAARLEMEKDIATLVSAMAIVSKTLPGVVCAVAGDGRQRRSLEAQVASLGVAEQVRLLGYRTDALALINAADLFVLPSIAEPFGLVLLEAMALGKAVIATRAGGPLEIVTRETGWLVTPRSESELASSILLLLQHPEIRRRMGEAARQRFKEQFTTERMAREVMAIYRKV
jgi:glycosyltransferase involved in cell wall biosynthesis